MNSSSFDPNRHHPSRASRIARGKTIAAVAARAGISKGHLSRMESGERRMSEGMEKRVRKAIGGRKG